MFCRQSRHKRRKPREIEYRMPENYDFSNAATFHHLNLADLLGNRRSFQRVQKVTVCNLWLVDFDPFLFQGSLPVCLLFRAIIDLFAAVFLIFLNTKCFPRPHL